MARSLAQDIGFARGDFQCRVQSDPPVARQGREAIHGAVADSACRHIDDAGQTHGIVRILQDAQVRDQILDFGPVIEARAAHHHIGQVVGAQGFFQHPRLPVGSIEDGKIPRRCSLGQSGLHRGGDVLGFLAFRVALENHDRIPGASVGEEPLGPPLAVGRDHGIGRAQDVSGRAVVLLQLDNPGPGMVTFKVEDVADVGPPPAVDGLILVTHHRDAACSP